jgi:hypothetical protein
VPPHGSYRPFAVVDEQHALNSFEAAVSTVTGNACIAFASNSRSPFFFFFTIQNQLNFKTSKTQKSNDMKTSEIIPPVRRMSWIKRSVW